MNALSNRTFLLYFVTNTLSLLGTWIQKIGVGWLTWELTHSTFWTSFVTLSLMAPAGIFGPLFAVFAEKWDMRKASLYLKLLMFFIGAWIWYLEHLNAHTLFTLAALSVVQGVIQACYHPVRLVFISEVVPREMLSSAVGLNAASFNASRVIGPSIAGLLILLFNLEITFLVALLTYIPLIPILLFIKLNNRQKSVTENKKFFARLIEGGKVAINNEIIFKCLFLVLMNGFFVRGMLEIQPTIAGEILKNGSFGLSLITAATGLGALLGSMWVGFGAKAGFKAEKVILPMLYAGFVVAVFIVFFNNLYISSFLFLVAGFTATSVGIGSQTIIQLEVDDSYRARVLTWWSTMSFGFLTLGGLILGYAGEIIPLRTAMIVMPIVGIIIFKVIWYYRFKNKFI